MSSVRAAWADLVLRHRECRKSGHQWERTFYGDAIWQMRGTHRCLRCHKIGSPPDDIEAVQP